MLSGTGYLGSTSQRDGLFILSQGCTVAWCEGAERWRKVTEQRREEINDNGDLL